MVDQAAGQADSDAVLLDDARSERDDPAYDRYGLHARDLPERIKPCRDVHHAFCAFFSVFATSTIWSAAASVASTSVGFLGWLASCPQ